MDPTTDVAKQHKHETKPTTKLLPSKTPATATRYVSVRYTACSLPSISEGIDRIHMTSGRDSYELRIYVSATDSAVLVLYLAFSPTIGAEHTTV